MKHFFTISLCFLALSLSAQEDCPNTYDGNADGAVTINDLLDLLAVFGDTDTDSDGIWDSIDDCIDLAACNYAADPTEACNYIDVLGNCGGGCEGDSDNDGICDSEDDCVGVYDECGVCNGPGATEVVIESITLLYDSVYAPEIDFWFVYETGADTTFSYECPPVLFVTCGDPISHDGYDYSTVLIGEQCWFSENCRYLPSVGIPSENEGTPNATVCGYNGTSVEDATNSLNYQLYGAQYNYGAISQWEICPTGWHVPSDDDWMEIEAFLGMTEDEIESVNDSRGYSVGAHLALKNTTGWLIQGNNSTGFSGMSGGWTSSSTDLCWYAWEDENDNGWAMFGCSDYFEDGVMFRGLTDFNGIGITRYIFGGTSDIHFSARCVQD